MIMFMSFTVVGVGVGGVELGVMAACIVLFVPMGMAGWHLSRNKMLFFSGVLFITLAVFVHLSPFFPSSFSNFFSDFHSVISSDSSSSDSSSDSSSSDSSSDSSSLVLFDRPQSCISFLHHIVFHPPQPPPPPLANNNISWDWSSSTPLLHSCDFQKLGLSDTCDLLNGSWVVVAGDSQARFFALSLLHLLLKNPQDMESAKSHLFKRHTDYHILIPDIGIKFDFIWAPFVSNLTNFFISENFNQTQNLNNNNYPPDVLVMGSGLWHMLHLTNESDYGVSLQLLRNSVVSLLPGTTDDPELSGGGSSSSSSVSIRSPHLFWLGMPMLINSMLNTPEKRDKMSNAALNAYDRELFKSKLLRQSGGPLFLLDMHSLTRSCGPRCTVDGMHYDAAVYEAAVHIMLNTLLIESHQKI